MTENERFGHAFAKTGSINSSTGLFKKVLKYRLCFVYLECLEFLLRRLAVVQTEMVARLQVDGDGRVGKILRTNL